MTDAGEIVKDFTIKYIGAIYRIFITGDYAFITLMDDAVELLPPIAYLAINNKECNKLLEDLNRRYNCFILV